MARKRSEKMPATAEAIETRIVRFDIDLDTHKKLRLIVAEEDTSIVDYMKKLLNDDIKRRGK